MAQVTLEVPTRYVDRLRDDAMMLYDNALEEFALVARRHAEGKDGPAEYAWYLDQLDSMKGIVKQLGHPGDQTVTEHAYAIQQALRGCLYHAVKQLQEIAEGRGFSLLKTEDVLNDITWFVRQLARAVEAFPVPAEGMPWEQPAAAGDRA